ncbi:hypothetical protein SCHPADRAFT_450749 [Schizopora paradoxa]|uniref:DUF6533 domain-containing protein n=1 Tax=Schizopora paradoxa TaxID=27342 RepID=A0A0H2RII8_9AGAM|nr:hypothetical protein SCHPADRAFT_450749 [Schizopora paradoxa]
MESNAEFAQKITKMLSTESYILAATITVALYDWLTILDDEVEFIWRKGVTLGKILYISMRTACAIYFSLCAFDLIITWLGVVFDKKGFIETASFRILPLMHEVLGTLVLQSSLVIQSMRVHAMYGQQTRMKIFLILLVAVSLVSSSVLYAIFPLNPDSITVDSQHVTRSNRFLGPQWLIIFALASESVIVVLVLYKFWCCRSICGSLSGFSTNEHLLSTMVRDSVKYYAAIFTVYAATLILAFLEPERKNLPVSAMGDSPILVMSIAFSSILSPRLILNIRREYYGKMHNSQQAAETLPWAAASRPAVVSELAFSRDEDGSGMEDILSRISLPHAGPGR